MKPQKHSLHWLHKNNDEHYFLRLTFMRNHRHPLLITLILTTVLVAGLITGCATSTEKKLKIKGFELSYKSKVSAGSSISKMQLHHPLKITQDEVRSHLESLTFEELSLFGKKKPVFLPKDIKRIERLLTKALQRVPSYKIIHYELETSEGRTTGDIFASKNHLHWRLGHIKGMMFAGRSNLGWDNTNWRMVPQSGQRFQTSNRLLGAQAQENWIIAERLPASKIKRKPRQNRPSKDKKEAPSRAPVSAPSERINPVLEEKLELLKNLHEKNLIDDNEFDQKKKELLDNYL